MQGAGLQTGCRPSKDGNDAMSMYALSETDSDYIRQPTPTSGGHVSGRRLSYFASDGRDHTGIGDDLLCILRCNIGEESECCIAQGSVSSGYQHEGTLHHISAILYAFLSSCNTVHSQGFYRVLYGGHGCIADSPGVLGNAGDNIAGTGQFLTVIAGILSAGDSKPSRVPEPASRPMRTISASLPPSSDQLLISPV